MRRRYPLFLAIWCLFLGIDSGLAHELSVDQAMQIIQTFRFAPLRVAIQDLRDNFGDRYEEGELFQTQLRQLECKKDSVIQTYHRNEQANQSLLIAYARELTVLRQRALLSNPLLDFEELLVVKRKNPLKGLVYPSHKLYQLGIPSNHECNSSLPRNSYENEIAVLSPVRPDGNLRTIYRPEHNGYVGMIDLHWDTDRLLFTQSDEINWKIWEIRFADQGLRQVSQMPNDVDAMDACYLPDDKIIFGSTASYQSVPCWHGKRWVSNLYTMGANGENVRQLCYDQDHDYHPSVLDNGQVIYTRWEYTGINHIFFRQLMVMNPDGSGQRAIYGSNSWFPNSLFFARQLPRQPGKLVAILSGYHGVPKMGQLAVIDTQKGWHATDGLVKRISGKGEPFNPIIRDYLVDSDWPKFMHPYPLNDKYYLVSCWTNQDADWAIYLADVFDNLILLFEDPDYALFEPFPVFKRLKPPVISTRVDLSKNEGTVFLQDVYAGPGLAGVPRDTVKNLRVSSYHFGYRHLAGPHKIGYGGPWEAMRILGLVPIESDGSAIFRVPANTPIAIQPLDEKGQAVQQMRSWFTVMPGEFRSCKGCHESPNELPETKPTIAALRAPRTLEPWYGPTRGFDFEREVQPVLDAYCVDCHNGPTDHVPDLRSEDHFPDYIGKK